MSALQVKVLSAQLAAMQGLQAENQKQATENDELRNLLLEKQGEIEALRVRLLSPAAACPACHAVPQNSRSAATSWAVGDTPVAGSTTAAYRRHHHHSSHTCVNTI